MQVTIAIFRAGGIGLSPAEKLSTNEALPFLKSAKLSENRSFQLLGSSPGAVKHAKNVGNSERVRGSSKRDYGATKSRIPIPS
jgi:hypothetical protein